MHELGIATAILDAVRTEADKCLGAHVTKVGVRIGALSCVEPEALAVLASKVPGRTNSMLGPGHRADSPRRQRCPPADITSRWRRRTWRVLAVRASTTLAGGERLDLAYLEVED